MRSGALSDVIKIWLYAAVTVLLGAWISPLFYNAGKALAEVSQSKDINGPVDWLAERCRNADFPAFFIAGVGVTAVILFFPFIKSLRTGRVAWQFCSPLEARLKDEGLVPKRIRDGARQAFAGFCGMVVLFLFIAAAMMLLGLYAWKMPLPSGGMWIISALILSVSIAIAQEFVFRAWVLGIFLRAMRPFAAMVMSALLFALLHFLIPPPGMTVADAEAPRVGLELLGKIIGQFTDLFRVIGAFLPLLTLGMVLAAARLRTTSLYLPIGLHAGWIFSDLLFRGIAVSTRSPDSWFWVISGSNLQQGVVPLVGIIMAGLLGNHLAPHSHEKDATV